MIEIFTGKAYSDYERKNTENKIPKAIEKICTDE